MLEVTFALPTTDLLGICKRDEEAALWSLLLCKDLNLVPTPHMDNNNKKSLFKADRRVKDVQYKLREKPTQE